MQSLRVYLAECLGTFALVFCGTGAIVINQETAGVVSHTGIAITFGLIVSAMIYTFGPVSGAHLNPAVTLALWVARVFPGAKILPYVLGQMAGAFAASGLLHVLFPQNTSLGATLPSGSVMQSFVLEWVLSFMLMLVILRVAVQKQTFEQLAGLIIGGVVLLEALFAGPVCGASMNPVRSLSPAVVSGHTEFLWLYLVAPTMGMLMAVGVWKLMGEKNNS
ncbi:MAG: aquaporin [Sediminibacterium sp.]|nr:aquaporin [Sediminibacterium sp.]